ncbi:hypothetical protein AGMMS4952_09830 [Spirochaetia bacterium]|nr:hypothetical protein AGMMS4952_09830 [Spirochaetia bacterium]
MNSKTHRIGVLILAILLNTRFIHSQSGNNALAEGTLAAGHSGTVSAVAYDPVKNYVISAGMDGFLGIWDVRNNMAVDRFQVSPYALRSINLRPGKAQAALVETDGIGVYRISAWDYVLKQNLFTLRFQDPIIFINYSAAGNFLMVARNDRIGVIFIHPETGEILDSPPGQNGAISFAATGRSERTMMTYAVPGRITYWELDTGREIQSAAAPANLESPVLFGNNRYLCGIDSKGLVVLDAVMGKEIARDQNAVRGALFPVAASDLVNQGLLEFMYLGSLSSSPQTGSANLVHYSITTHGNLESVTRNIANLQSNSVLPLISGGVSAGGGSFALGTVDGGIWLLGADDRVPRAMNRLRLTYISSVAVSGNSMALITDNANMSVIPLDYQMLQNGNPITLEDSRGNTRVSGDSGIPAGSPGRFLFWQTENPRSFPTLVSDAGTRARRDTTLEHPFRYPLRSASLLGNQALFLDAAGNITLVSTGGGPGAFTYSATDPLDVSFYDSRNIIIGQAAAAKTAPFLLVNTVTQETAPFIYPAAVGAKLYRAPDGRIYGGVVDGSADGAVTTLLLLNFERPSASIRMIEYPGEDTTFIIATSGRSIATTIGGNGPTLHSSQGFIPFRQAPSLPENLIGSDRYFIVLGKDGSVSWNNPGNGALLARLRLVEREWILETAERTLRGALNKN